MTEAEWLACDDPLPMLEHLARIGSGRKLRLFACQFCRGTELWRRLVAHRADGHVRAVERWLESEGGSEDLVELARFAPQGYTKGGGYSMGRKPVHLGIWAQAMNAVAHLSDANAWEAAWGVVRDGANFVDSRTSALLREIIGDPFRPLVPVPVPAHAVVIAQAAYDERQLPSGHLDNARLAVLSDALEEAGCTNAVILSHLRSPGPHARGCWALDLVLGKE